MFESRKISSELMVICLLRIEKTPKSSASGRREVLQRLGSELKEVLPKKKLGQLEEQFLVLGGASSALLISSSSLNKIAEIKRTIHTSINSVIEESKEIDSDLFVFPAVSVSSKSSHSELPIPLLVFMQTRLFVDPQRRRIPHSEGLVGTNVMIGFGSYECI